MPRKGGRRKKARTHVESGNDETGTVGTDVPKSDVPKSIVAKASKVSPHVGSLVKDLRKMMGPFTATNLKERSYNRVKDYLAVASQLGISHILAVSETKSNIVLRIARFQNGPTLHFKIPQYSLAKNVRSLQKRPFDSTSAYLTPPLVVLNNFSRAEESHLQLMRITLQHMFPSINVNTVRLNECRRVVLFHYIKENSTVEMRHYAIRASPVGISRNIKKIIQAKIPKLGNLQDISEFLEGGATGGLSDSEAEDDPAARVELPERYVGAGNAQSQQSAMRLMELGPRMTLELFKVEKGLCEGDVLFHKFEQKSPAEAAATKAKVEAAKNLKIQRRAQQEENVRRKRDLAEVKRSEKEERKKRRLEGGAAASDSDDEESDDEESDDDSEQGGDRDMADEDDLDSDDSNEGDEGDYEDDDDER